jgi:cyclic pyranopterin phosphate synthase
MPPLLAPSALGDVLDRLAILDVKAANVRDGASRTRVAEERAALARAWREAGLGEPETQPEWDALGEVNRELWAVEDRLREAEARSCFDGAFVADARRVYRVNDRRAALKRAVNDRLGSALREVKQHPRYAAGMALTHVDADGNARMVDVADKAVTARQATAEGWVRMGSEALSQVRARTTKKGDVLAVAQLAGIQAAKRTGELIPLCHPLPLDGVQVTLDAHDDGVRVQATVRCTGRTGVEMEALTAVTVAALTVYDMLKAVDRGMRVEGVRLLAKSGGRSGEWRAS